MQEIKIYKSSGKAIKLILISSVFVAGGFFILFNNKEDTAAAWFCICFFGLCLLVGLFQLLDRRPQIIINELGIFDRMAHKDFINWLIIQDAYLMAVNKQSFISLVVDEQFKPSRNKRKVYKKVARLNESLGFQELNISLSTVNVDEEKLLQLIRQLKNAQPRERASIINALPAGINI